LTDDPLFLWASPYQADVLALPVADVDAAILVSDIGRARAELQANGLDIANERIDERDGVAYRVFFVVAPDGLCFYFHQPVSGEAQQ
jgi:hypothetical protein